MFEDRSRHAEVGDLIIQRPSARGLEHLRWVGMVYKTEKGTVWIHWNSNRPPTYNVECGYTAVNIHNLRSNFDVVKA